MSKKCFVPSPNSTARVRKAPRLIEPTETLRLVELLGEHHAAQALVVTLDGSSLLTLTFSGGLFVEFASAKFGKKTRLFDGALEAAEGNFKRFVFFNADSRH